MNPFQTDVNGVPSFWLHTRKEVKLELQFSQRLDQEIHLSFQLNPSRMIPKGLKMYVTLKYGYFQPICTVDDQTNAPPQESLPAINTVYMATFIERKGCQRELIHRADAEAARLEHCIGRYFNHSLRFIFICI